MYRNGKKAIYPDYITNICNIRLDFVTYICNYTLDFVTCMEN